MSRIILYWYLPGSGWQRWHNATSGTRELMRMVGYCTAVVKRLPPEVA